MDQTSSEAPEGKPAAQNWDWLDTRNYSTFSRKDAAHIENTGRCAGGSGPESLGDLIAKVLAVALLLGLPALIMYTSPPGGEEVEQVYRK